MSRAVRVQMIPTVRGHVKITPIVGHNAAVPELVVIPTRKRIVVAMELEPTQIKLQVVVVQEVGATPIMVQIVLVEAALFRICMVSNET